MDKNIALLLIGAGLWLNNKKSRSNPVSRHNSIDIPEATEIDLGNKADWKITPEELNQADRGTKQELYKQAMSGGLTTQQALLVFAAAAIAWKIFDANKSPSSPMDPGMRAALDESDRLRKRDADPGFKMVVSPSRDDVYMPAEKIPVYVDQSSAPTREEKVALENQLRRERNIQYAREIAERDRAFNKKVTREMAATGTMDPNISDSAYQRWLKEQARLENQARIDPNVSYFNSKKTNIDSSITGKTSGAYVDSSTNTRKISKPGFLAKR